MPVPAATSAASGSRSSANADPADSSQGRPPEGRAKRAGPAATHRTTTAEGPPTKGITVNRATLRVWDDDACSRVHQASLTLLERTGVEMKDGRARALCAAAGATVEGTRVRIPAALVDDALASAPRSWQLRPRGGGPRRSSCATAPATSAAGPTASTSPTRRPASGGAHCSPTSRRQPGSPSACPTSTSS